MLLLALDESGNVFVTGSSAGGDGSFDFATIKYSSATLLPVPLHYQVVGSRLVLSWTNTAFGLQSALTVDGSYTNVFGTVSPYTNAMTIPK